MKSDFRSGSIMLAATMILSLMFSSCSRDLTSVQKSNQLVYEQSAPQPEIQPVEISQQKVNSVTTEQKKRQAEEVLTLIAPEKKNEILSGKKEKVLPTALALAKEIVTDDAARKNIPELGSRVVKGQSDVAIDSNLKIGIILLILGLLISALGGKYSIFYVIGSILAIIGLVFILLWAFSL